MTALPLLLKPKLWSIKNRIGQDLKNRRELTRDLVLLGFCVALMFALYTGTTLAIGKIIEFAGLAYLSPAIPLSLVLVLLFSMLIFSNSVSALSALFLAHDLEMLLAAPMKPLRFFSAKIIEVLLSSSWMALVFGLPVFIAFGAAYSAAWQYYILFPVFVLIYFLLASALAVLIVSIFARIIPASRTKEIMLLVCALAFCSVYFVAKYAVQHSSAFNSAQELLRMARVLSVPHKQYLPSYWVSTTLSEIITPTGLNVLPHIAVLLSTLVSVLSLSYLLVTCLHAKSYSRARSNKSSIAFNARISQRWANAFLTLLARQSRALLLKDYRQIGRDVSQAVQLLLLLGLCAVYLYNFQIMSAATRLEESQKIWWHGFLLVSNLSLGSFVLTAIGTRFIFPSISLEGQCWWLIQSAPISMRNYLVGKYKTWLPPTLFIGLGIFYVGSSAIQQPALECALSLFFCLSLGCAIVGLAVGLGAEFANFNWEHPSQLAASFGSLVYMLISAFLIAVNVLPFSAALVYYSSCRAQNMVDPGSWTIFFIGLFALLNWINARIVIYAFDRGARSLLPK